MPTVELSDRERHAMNAARRDNDCHAATVRQPELPWYDSVITLLWVKREITKGEREEDSLLAELDPEEFTLRRKRWPGKR